MQSEEITLEESSPYTMLGYIVFCIFYPIMTFIFFVLIVMYLPKIYTYTQNPIYNDNGLWFLKYSFFVYVPLITAAFIYFVYDIINTTVNVIVLTDQSITHKTFFKTKTIRYEQISNIEIIQMLKYNNIFTEILNRIIGSNYHIIISDDLHKTNIHIKDMSKTKVKDLKNKIESRGCFGG